MPVPTSNPDSWAAVIEGNRGYPDTPYWNQWRLLMDSFLHEAIGAGYDQLFRAGKSMHHVLLSTLDHHGLKGEPHVTVSVTEDWNIKIEYSTANTHFRTAIHSETVSSKEAFQMLTKYLQHLWTETVPEPIPDALRKQRG